jgi:hypothetical protein
MHSVCPCNIHGAYAGCACAANVVSTDLDIMYNNYIGLFLSVLFYNIVLKIAKNISSQI